MYAIKYPDLLFHQHHEIPINLSIFNDNEKVCETVAVLDTGLDVPLCLSKKDLEGLNHTIYDRQIIRSFDGSRHEYDLTKLTIRIFDLLIIDCPILIAGEIPTLGLPILKYLNLSISHTEITGVTYNLDAITESAD